MAVLQGMSAGVPVVASNVGGITDVIQDGAQGILIEPDDPHALIGALKCLLGDPALRSRLGNAGRSHVEEKFSISRMAENHLAIYGSVSGDHL